MKKLFTSLTALALVSAMVVPMAAFATSTVDNNDGGNSTTVEGNVGSNYTVYIPATLQIDGAAANVTVAGIMPVNGIWVTAGGDFTATLVGGGQTAPSGTFKINGNSSNFTFALANTLATQLLTATWDTAPAVAGNYRGTLTFNISETDPSQA